MNLANLAQLSLWWLGQMDAVEDASALFKTITLGRVANAVLSVILAYALLSGGQTLANWLSEKVPRRSRLIIKQSIPFWKGTVLIVLIAHVAGLFLNVSEQNLFAITGTVAVAVGFAFKDYITSVIAGVVALFEAPYRVGDRITIGDHYGEVVSYGLRGIRLHTFDDDLITIPHSKTWTEAIINANSGSLEAQVATDVYFDHGVDAEAVTDILYQAAYSSRFTQLNLPIVVVIAEKPWGTHFKLRAYPLDIRNEPAFRTDILRRAKAAFAQRSLPYPKVPPFTDMED